MFLLDPSIFFWDFLILFALTMCVTIAIASTVLLRRRQRGVLRMFGIELMGGVSVFCAFVIVYSAFIEPKTLVVTEYDVDLDIVNPIKVAVISDMQVGPYKGKKYLEQVVTETNRLLPDFVLLPGDFILNDFSDVRDLLPLRNLRASAGVYAVLGNHDQGKHRTLFDEPKEEIDRGEDVAAYLESIGIHVLRNEHEVVSLGTETIVIAGIDDMWTGHGDVATALVDAPEQITTILLSHNPSIIEDEQTNAVDMIVSGHTHGGQIRLPFLGPVRHIPISIDQSYDQGLFELSGKRYLAITRGVGETWMRARLLAWPEIMLLNVH